MTGTRLVLVRHGESIANVERRIAGHRTCRGLTDQGREEARLLRDRLLASVALPASALLSSAHPRAVETARIVAPALGSLPVEVDPGWGEHDPGPSVDGMTYPEFVAAHGEPDWQGDPSATIFPGGETVDQFIDRVRESMDRVVASRPGATVVVSTHGGVIGVVMRSVLGLPRVGGAEILPSNASLTEVIHGPGPGWRLVRYNDAAHLEGR